MTPELHNEPARWIGAIVGLITAVCIALVAFGIEVTDDQRDAILGVAVALGAIIPLIQAEITRHNVYSPDSAQRIADTVAADAQRGVIAADPRTGHVPIPAPPADTDGNPAPAPDKPTE